jgi:hypothetical protein
VKKTGEKDDSVTDKNVVEPNVLYKYYAFNKTFKTRTKKIFKENEIYFATPEQFNDPFDSRVGLSYEGTEDQWIQFLDDWYSRNEPSLLPEQRRHKVNICLSNRNDIPKLLSFSFLKKMGVYCMSEINDDILMWSHYSEGHTGFCLKFDANNEFFGRSQKITYSKNYPNVNFFANTQLEKTQAMLLTKAQHWDYEKEWRIIDYKEGSGIKHFPEKHLIGVIIGCHMLEGNKQKIIKWCTDRNPRPTLYETKPKTREFGLDIIQINYS